MEKKKKLSFPTAFTVLFIVLFLAAALTHFIDAGSYAKLQYNADDKIFVETHPDGSTEELKATQATLDKLGIKNDIKKFTDGSIYKPIAIPGTYEKVKANYYNDEEKDSQLMLLPDIITLSHKEMEIAKDNMQMFRKAGFMVEEFGENTLKLTGVPEMCLDLETKEMFLETLDEINSVSRTAKQEVEERFIATVACKAAVKANMALTKEEVDALMDKLLILPNPFTCPHGRPTAIKMSRYDIEKKFARV